MESPIAADALFGGRGGLITAAFVTGVLHNLITTAECLVVALQEVPAPVPHVETCLSFAESLLAVNWVWLQASYSLPRPYQQPSMSIRLGAEMRLVTAHMVF